MYNKLKMLLDNFIKQKIITFWVPRILICLIDMLLASCRIKVEGLDRENKLLKKRPSLAVSWHGRLILYFLGPRSEKPCTMASQSRAGYLASLLQETGGYLVFRGSSRKGGMQALMKMQKYMKRQNCSAMLSVDGSSGPKYVMKPGAVYLAAALSCPIVPVSFSAKRMKVLDSWDRLVIPWPFTDCTVIYGKPFLVPPDSSDADMATATQLIQDELRRITQIADSRYGHRIE